jgi:hypothetical protein
LPLATLWKEVITGHYTQEMGSKVPPPWEWPMYINYVIIFSFWWSWPPLELCPQPFFAVVISWIESFVFAWGWPQTLISLILVCLLHSWASSHAQLCPVYLLRWCLPNFFAQAGLEPQSSWSPLPE